MSQQTFADASLKQYRKPTPHERFLAEMEQVIPWKELAGGYLAVVSQGGGAGRPPIGVAWMLRIHILQPWFYLSDPAVEDALYDSRARRHFVGIDLGRELVSDETTICKFRHLLETHQLGEQLFGLIRTYLAEHGLHISRGIIVDATIINVVKSQSGPIYSAIPMGLAFCLVVKQCSNGQNPCAVLSANFFRSFGRHDVFE